MKNKYLYIVFLILFYHGSLLAQQKLLIHEVGFSVDLDLTYRLSYKVGKPNSLFRLQTLFLKGEGEQNGNTREGRHEIGFSLGTEFRKKVIENLKVVYGFDLGLNYGLLTSQVGSDPEILTFIITPNINLVLGLNYTLKEHWIFSLELKPYFNYIIESEFYDLVPTKESTRFEYGFNFASIQLGIAYRIFKNK